MRRTDPIETPTEIFRGDLLFYIAKFGLGMMGLMALAIGVFGFALGVFATLREGYYDIEMFGLTIILMFTLFNGLFIGIIFLHMYPEVGISENHLWFRHFGFWQSVPWTEVTDIRPAKTLFVTQGLVIYSNSLPFYYRFFGRAYGRKGGKALFVPSQIARFSELEAILQRHI